MFKKASEIFTAFKDMLVDSRRDVLTLKRENGIIRTAIFLFFVMIVVPLLLAVFAPICFLIHLVLLLTPEKAGPTIEEIN